MFNIEIELVLSFYNESSLGDFKYDQLPKVQIDWKQYYFV